MHEIVSSKLIYGVSTKNDDRHVIDFIKLFDTKELTGGGNDYTPVSNIECYKHDPIGKMLGEDVDAIFIAGITLGVSFTDICRIDPAVLDTANSLFEGAVQEFNNYMNKLGSDYTITLTPQLLLFGEGFTQDG